MKTADLDDPVLKPCTLRSANGEPVWDVAARYLCAKRMIAPLIPNLPPLTG